MEACRLADPSTNKIEPEGVDRILVQAVDEALLAIGSSGRTAVYAYLAKNYGLKPEALPQKIDVLDELLTSVFGSSAGVMKRLILRIFHSRLGCQHSDLDTMPQFKIYLKHARQLVRSAPKRTSPSPAPDVTTPLLSTDE